MAINDALHERLAGARVKADRGLRLWFVLQKEIEDFDPATAYSIRPVSVDGDWTAFHLEVHREPPPDLALLAGEIVYNARAALDYAVYALAGDSADFTNEFPLLDTRSEFNRVAARYLHGLEESRRLLIESSQPFDSDERHPLRLLRRFSNVDKHRFLQPAFATAESMAILGNPLSSGPHVEARSSLAPHQRLGDGTELGRWRPRAGAPRGVRASIQVDLRIAFGEDAVRDDELSEMAGTASAIVLTLSTRRDNSPNPIMT